MSKIWQDIREFHKQECRNGEPVKVWGGSQVSAEFILSMRVASLPEPHVPSTEIECALCKSRIWLPNAAPAHISAVCLECFPTMLAAAGRPLDG